MPNQRLSQKYDDLYRVATVLDTMHGLEAKAMVMKFVGGYTETQMAEELAVNPEEARRLAYEGLKQAKDIFFQTKTP